MFIICNISVYCTFIFILCCYFILVMIFIIYTFLHLNRGNVIWASSYYLIQGIPIIFFFVLCNIYVYYTFIFIISCYLFLIILFIIYTLIHINRGSVIWASFYYLNQGIPTSFFFVLCNISLYYTFILILCFFIVIIFIICTFLYINRKSVL